MLAPNPATVATFSCSMPSVRRFITACTLLAALAVAGPAGAKMREVGLIDNKPLPAPSCPTQCQAVDQVTGYQVQIGAAKNPYLLHRKGKIVAFTIALGKPTKKQTTFFQNLFGTRPTARLSIIKL